MELFLCLLLAHLVADFVLQTREICKEKAERKWKSPQHYIHSFVVFGLSWAVTFDWEFWWCALIIGVLHFGIDIWKSYHDEKVTWFTIDQILHITVLACVASLWNSQHKWTCPPYMNIRYVSFCIATLLCWKPANIFIKLMLKYHSVNMPNERESIFNAGALIGTLERWLILIFVCMQRYEAIGLLIAAKSIIRFSEKDTTKTEYVLAGTLLSIFIAVLSGIILMIV